MRQNTVGLQTKRWPGLPPIQTAWNDTNHTSAFGFPPHNSTDKILDMLKKVLSYCETPTTNWTMMLGLAVMTRAVSQGANARTWESLF